MTENEQHIQEPFLTPEVERQERPFQWDDEIGVPGVESGLEEISPSYTSVAELLDNELDIEIKRLVELDVEIKGLKDINFETDPSKKP